MFDGKIEKDRVVGAAATGRNGVDLLDEVHSQTAAKALVRDGRCGVAVTQNGCSSCQRRLNSFAHVLGPAGGIKEKLGERVQLNQARVEYQLSDTLCSRSAPRLSGGDDRAVKVLLDVLLE